MTTGEYVIEVLGGTEVFRRQHRADPAALRTCIRDGLPYSALESVRQRLHLSLPETAIILQTPLRTLARRRRERKLHATESDRLYRFARVVGEAVMTFGTEEKAAAWLRRENRSLNNHTPLQLLDTEVGTRQVEDVLGRIQFGVTG